nr:hypothetical protein [Clostridia bacterium]
MTNDKGESNPPIPVEVALENGNLSGEIAANLKWNISNDNGNLTIYPNGTTDTWLYCTSTNNGVRVGTNGNKVFTIDDTSGYLKNTATRRYLGVYSTQDWRCYTSTTTNINDQTLGFYVLHTAKISAAQLQIDDTLAIKYLVTVGDGGCDASKLAIRFTYGENGDVVTTVGNGELQADGRYAFLLTKLAPQSMTDNVKAELLCDGVVIDTVEEYSIKQYAANMIKEHSDDADLVRLLSDMLHYGAAAQNYLGYKTDNLANDGVEGILDAKTDTVPDAEKSKNVVDNSNVNLTAAGVRFDYNNKVYIRFTATDISVVTAFVNGVEAEIVEAGDVYTVYSEGITANNFATAQTFEVKVDGVVVLTVNYSVNAYCGVKGNGTNEAAALAKAMYFYGFAAEAYEA